VGSSSPTLFTTIALGDQFIALTAAKGFYAIFVKTDGNWEEALANVTCSGTSEFHTATCLCPGRRDEAENPIFSSNLVAPLTKQKVSI